MSYETLLVERVESAGIITLNRPAALNAINNLMMDEFGLALAELEADADVRVIVVTGAGRAFSAGRDMKEIGTASHRTAADVWIQIEDLGKPVIAAVNGACYTGALSMLLCFDLVVAADVATFADTHAKFGMNHGGGTTQRLRNAVGPIRAKELLFTCKPINADEAQRIGLVNRVVPLADLLTEVLELARTIAGNDPGALRTTKMLINHGTTWGSAMGFELERREYRSQRRAVAEGAATISVTNERAERRDG
jgi:enoyl-CoA hydratase/carnithine racemase